MCSSNKLRLFVAALMTACLAIAPVLAQSPGQGPGGKGFDPEKRIQMQIDRLSQRLSLSDEQREQIKPILLDSARKMGELRSTVQRGDGDGVDPKAMREARRKIQSETDSKLAAILDEEQMKRYREMPMMRSRSRSEQPGSPSPN